MHLGPASGAQVRKDGEKWTLISRERTTPSAGEGVAGAQRPSALREWAPFEVDGSLDTAGAMVKLTWVATAKVTEARVTRAYAPKVLEFHNIRWELEALGGGTRLTLWHSIPPRFIAGGAAGWHICFDVLDRLLAAEPIERIPGADSIRSQGWQRLTAEYAQQFGDDPPKWAPPKPE